MVSLDAILEQNKDVRLKTSKAKALIAQSCLTLCDPIDCSTAGLSVHGILQARILEWVAIPFSWLFLTQGSNPSLLHCRQIVYHLSNQGSDPWVGKIPWRRE